MSVTRAIVMPAATAQCLLAEEGEPTRLRKQGVLRVTRGAWGGANRGSQEGAVMMDDNGYAKTAPTRAEVDALAGATVLEFGTDWCGHCQGAQRYIAESLGRVPQLRHVKIEDGPGRPLGRSFRVKLWPTLIFLRDGVEVARVVRPIDTRAVDEGVAALV